MRKNLFKTIEQRRKIRLGSDYSRMSGDEECPQPKRALVSGKSLRGNLRAGGFLIKCLSPKPGQISRVGGGIWSAVQEDPFSRVGISKRSIYTI